MDIWIVEYICMQVETLARGPPEMPELVSVGEGREELDQMVFTGNGGRQHEVSILMALDVACWL